MIPANVISYRVVFETGQTSMQKTQNLKAVNNYCRKKSLFAKLNFS